MKDVRTGILVGASPLGAEAAFLKDCLEKKSCISVAADGGLSFFAQNHIAPDCWIGDLDSAEAAVFEEAKDAFSESEFIRLPREKDDTDMRVCMLKLKELGAKTVLIFGGLGGERTDHTMANIQLLHEFAEEGIRAFLISEKEYFYVLTAGTSVTYPKESKGTLSVFSLAETTELSIRDLYYEFEGILNNKRAMGVSNEFCKKGGTLKVSKGAALIVRSESFPEDEGAFADLL